ncbi:MAG: hypothetical protein AAGG07_02135 [Planctomycetota bacterium]
MMLTLTRTSVVLSAAGLMLAAGGCASSSESSSGWDGNCARPIAAETSPNTTTPGFGDGTEILAETAPEPIAEANAPARPENGDRYSYDSNLNLFGDMFAQSLPTELENVGESPDTANRTQVTFTHEGSDFDPTVTRDGRTLVFSSTQHRVTGDIYTRPIDSHVVTQITQHPANDVMPAPSPDGRRVAFASDRNGNWDLFVMPIGGGNAVQITQESAHELHPSWSPDGNRLVFSRLGEVSGRWELWVVDLNRPGIAHFIGFGLFPEWCPVSGSGAGGSDKIVFQRSRERGERAFSVWTLDYADGVANNQTQVAYSNFSALINPTWSPDGQRIVYASVPNPSDWNEGFNNAEPELAALHMIDAFGADLITLTSGNSVDLMPFWSTEHELFFVSNRNGSENIWSLDAGEAIFAATGNYPDGRREFADFGRDGGSQGGGRVDSPLNDPFASVPVPADDN